MRRCVLILLAVLSSLGLYSCAENATGAVQGAPELLKAVPSDALCVGLFGRLDHGLDRMVDSLSSLRSLDYGRLSRARAAIALCDVGSVTPLLVIEAGKSDADTLEAVHDLMALADSFKIANTLVALETHNTLLLSESATVLTVACRHIAAESSILDAPGFDQVLAVLPQADAVALRNRGAVRLKNMVFGPVDRKALTAFLRDAAEWTVVSGTKLWPLCPDEGRYFTNFVASIPEAPSKLSSAFPEGASAIVDMPVASISEWREAYEKWLDARIELESYQKRIAALGKASGKNPLNWEKELGVKELACVIMPQGTLNMVRTSKSASSDGVVTNPYKGFVRALYGSVFNSADSCCMRHGSWLISGDRALLDSFKVAGRKPSDWPAGAKVVAWAPDKQLNWTKESIRIWDSNR
ncbi:MAG: hypothetical protein IKX67_10170 [Bacteroidales bacterium]|nr:hypothetical protein [Bacteroidales bacterium]